MSHTDIHRPTWVMYQDPSMRRHFREHHHHPHGVCDLEIFVRAWLAGSWVRTNCLVQWQSAEQRICSCEMCAMRPARKRMRRRERHGARRSLHQAAAQYAAGDLDEDLPRSFRADTW